jgi:hypothetical protein
MDNSRQYDRFNTFEWTNFDGKIEVAEEHTLLYLLSPKLDSIEKTIRFKYIGEHVIKGVKYLIINTGSIFDASSDIVLDSRLLFTSNIEAFEYIYRYEPTRPEAPTFTEIEELMTEGYPWW